MARPSVTVTATNTKLANKHSNDSAGENSMDAKSQGETEHETDSSTKQTPRKPNTKEQLIDLYRTEPLKLYTTANSKDLLVIADERAALYRRQQQRNEFFYTAHTSIRPTYMVQILKPQFDEYEQYQMVRVLDQRGILDLDKLELTWQQIHVVDDLIVDIVRHMPAQKPVGWQLTSASKNHLKLPTVGRLRDTLTIADQGSLTSYVMGHFGVMSYTYDRAYYIGHVMGYLFCCYYLAHLSIAYGVTPLPEKTVADYDYVSLETPKMVRLLQGVDVHCKRRIYQLAVLCARLSSYKIDKYAEKLLIAEVNEFDKKQQITHLDMLLNNGLMPDMPDMIEDKIFPGTTGDK